MSTAAELYEVNLVSSSKLKLRAKAGLAEGTAEAIFDACVLFHEAARLERRAVEALSPCPPEARLAGSIEECWCLLEGSDPDAAAAVWSRILSEQEDVDRATAQAMLVRLRPRYDKSVKLFARAVQSHPALTQIGRTQVLVPTSSDEQKKALRALQTLLQQFPGVPGLWAGASRLADVTGNRGLEWDAINRALRLDPDNTALRASSLIVAAERLRPAEADEYLAPVYSTLHRAEAEVCLMLAFGEVVLAERSPATRTERWKRAASAVNAAYPQARSEWMTKLLNGLSLFLDAAIAKRKPDPDLLYRAGLGRLAATSGGKPIDALLTEATARVGAMYGSSVAA
ncbi:MAG: hypothetical protein WDO69_18690 [Pseudomonadota bacterium]